MNTLRKLRNFLRLFKSKSQRRIGGAKDLVLFMAEDFDDPLEDFSDYM